MSNPLVPQHIGPFNGEMPPSNMLQVLVEHDKPHCYWNGEFREFDGDRFATFSWRTPAGHLVHYVAIRVLWVYQNNIDPKERLKLAMTCGLVSCVKVAHVERIAAPHIYGLHKPLRMRDGASLEPRISGIFVHLVPDDASYALCGKKLKARAGVLYNQPITCTGCLGMAHGAGYTLDVLS